MFLHLGGDVVVPKNQVIAIVNTQLMKKAEVNREFLQLAEDEGFVEYITEKSNAKSIILTSERIYLSPISSMTLKKRSDDIIENNDENSIDEPW